MRVAKLTVVDSAIVRCEEVHEPLVVRFRYAEQLQERAVVPPADAESAAHELTNIVSRNVSDQEQRMNVLPERISAADDRLIQIVGDLAAALACREDRLSSLDRLREIVDTDGLLG